MRTTRAAWAAMAAACLGFLVMGCGGGSGEAVDDPAEFAQAPSPPPPGPEAEPAPPDETAPPEEMSPPAEAAPVPPEEMAPQGEAAPLDEPGEPAEAEKPGENEAPSAKSGPGTDDLLALAKTAASESKPGGSEGQGHDDYDMGGDPSMDATMEESMVAYPGAEGISEEMLGGAGLDLDALGGMAGVDGVRDSKAKEPDFDSPSKSAETFLDALKHRDIRILAESTALRAQYEAETARIREMFMALRSESLDPETLDDLARAFDGMEIVGMNTRKSTGSAGVIVGKREGTKLQTRTLTVRHEKDGWKVMDFSGPRVQDIPQGRPGRGNSFRRRR